MCERKLVPLKLIYFFLKVTTNSYKYQTFELNHQPTTTDP